jgi:hypothetical protein
MLVNRSIEMGTGQVARPMPENIHRAHVAKLDVLCHAASEDQPEVSSCKATLRPVSNGTC